MTRTGHADLVQARRDLHTDLSDLEEETAVKLRPARLAPAAGFVAWCLADLARDPAPRLLPAPAWTAAIVLFRPLGGIAWLVLGRSGRRRRRR